LVERGIWPVIRRTKNCKIQLNSDSAAYRQRNVRTQIFDDFLTEPKWFETTLILTRV
jgi:hypothetical protein